MFRTDYIHYLRFFLSLCLSFSLAIAHSQFKDDFSDGQVNDLGIYLGDVDNFIVNDDFELQLNALDGGSSMFFTQITFADSILWSFDMRLEFAPSGSNEIEFVIWADDMMYTDGNAFSLQIGETGSDDAVRFVQYIDGQEMELASGTLGAAAADPVDLSLTISKSSDDEWLVDISYLDSGLSDQLLLNLNTPDLSGSHFFGFTAGYTSTRTDKFFFDNFCVGPLLPDTEGPVVEALSLIDNQSLSLRYNEAISDQVESMPSSFVVNGGATPSSILLLAANEVLLSYDQAFLSGSANELVTSGVNDLNGNSSAEQRFEFFLVEAPAMGDLLINEVMFDPFPNGTDFIELYNNSDKILDLSQLMIANFSRDELKPIPSGLSLLPGEYILFNEDSDFLRENYTILDDEALVEVDLPAFNNDSGNYSIVWEGTVLDSFDYEEDYHFVLIDDTEGVSLERLSFDAITNQASNWNSAASVAGFATPGYQNSNQLNFNPGEEMFSIAEKVFSPNEDGQGDDLVISYQLEESGFVGTVKIFDARGREELTLINNELLSAEGFVLWDGINALGERSPVGIYIVYISAFNEAGVTFNKKMTCVLADFLE